MVAFLNWRKLTDRHHQFKMGPLLDGFDEARIRNVDVFADMEF